MAKKRLSDLLREEVGDDRPAATEEAKPQADSPDAKTIPSRRKRSRSKASEAEPSPASKTNSPTPSPKPSSGRSRAKKTTESKQTQVASTPPTTSDPTPVAALDVAALEAKQAELEAAIAQLQEQLESAHRREEHLRQQVVDLEDALEAEQGTVVNLKAELRQANQVRTELEEARQTILKLSEAASSATRQVTALKQELATVTTKSGQAISRAASEPSEHPAPLRPSTSLQKSDSQPASSGLSRHHQELNRVLRHPVPPDVPSTAFSNDDLGWVD